MGTPTIQSGLMASRDYYDILGVSKKASADEIRNAYRKLVRQLHPDVNKAPDAQKKFTEVQNAYDTLSDDKKRGIYDLHGPGAFETGSAQEAAARAQGGPHYSWQNVGGGRGGPVNMNGMDFDSEDISSIFESVFGGGAGGVPRGGTGGPKKRGRKTRAHEPREAVERELDVDFMSAATGGSQTLRISSGGAVRTVEVTIPAGIETGRQLRMRGGSGGGDDPDILLLVKVLGHKWFRRGEFEHTGKGLDLYVEVPISIAEATLGASVSVPTLTDHVEVAIPPGTPSGRRLRLRGLGIRDAGGRQGDLYAIVKIVPPLGATLTPTEADQLRAIAEKAGPQRPW